MADVAVAGQSLFTPCLRRCQRFQQFLALRYGARLVHLHPLHHAVAIQHVRGAFVEALLIIEDAVGFAGRTVWPVVGHQRERQAAQLFHPHFQTGYGVGADLQDLDVQRFELCVVLTEPADLIFSPAGKCERQESHNRFASTKARQRKRLRRVGCQRKIRRLRTSLKSSHYVSPVG